MKHGKDTGLIRKPKLKIGWEEWCGFPDLDLPAVLAKVDTGAKTSALHAYDIETFIHHTVPYVRFKINPLPKKKHIFRVCQAPLTENRVVISSNGES